jgi:toxin ParE1/3/4
MRLVFDDRAVADLENIYHWISQESPATAKAVIERLLGSIELLTSFPLIGHAGRDAETFEWVVPRLPYIVVYEVDRAGEQVLVTAVFHGAQDRRGEAEEP